MDMKQYQKENAEIQYKHRYWGWQIALYLFLGGLGGGILFLTWVMSTFVFPGVDLTQAFMLPNFIALLVIAFGLFCLVEELGQPPVFYRAYVTATSIIKWGAVLLTIASFGDLFWLLGNWSPATPVLGFLSVFNFLGGLSGVWLAAAGLSGFGIMVYTGVMLSTLKAHSFWSTPALPVLFTTSALSTACAGIIFWIGMVGLGLVVPLICNATGNPLAANVACVLVLCGGCLLRFLCVWSDDRQPIEGENRYYWRHKHANMDFATYYSKPGKELKRGENFAYIDNQY